MSRGIQECVAQRVHAFHMSAGLKATWLLLSHGPVAHWLKDVGVHVDLQPSFPQKMAKFGTRAARGIAPRSAGTKPSFRMWVLTHPEYEHAWHAEQAKRR